jgi:hypothetical protein
MSQDVVGIYDEEFRQLIPEGRPVKATVTEPAKLMEHPLEDGSVVTDHRIIQPTEIELSMIADYETYEVFSSIRAQAETIAVQTRSSTYLSMVIESISHDETTDVYDRMAIVLKLKHVEFVETQFQSLPPRSVAPSGSKGKRNASTVKRGEQTATETKNGKTKSVAAAAYDAIFGGG